MMVVNPESEGEGWNLTWSTVNGMIEGQMLVGSRVLDVRRSRFCHVDIGVVPGAGVSSVSVPAFEFAAPWEWTDTSPMLAAC